MSEKKENKLPSFINDNPWVPILADRGKDSGTPLLPEKISQKPDNSEKEILPNETTQPRFEPNNENERDEIAPPPRRKGKAWKMQRQALVLRCFLQHYDVMDIVLMISRAMGQTVSRATIFRDLAELKPVIQEYNQREAAYTLQQAILELDTMMNSAWIQYNQGPQRTALGAPIDPSYRRLNALQVLLSQHRHKAQLLGFLREDFNVQMTVVEFHGVEIRTRSQIDGIVSAGGIEYAKSRAAIQSGAGPTVQGL
ncbi:MAG: hypothetical protein V1857_06240 [archaeon]